MAGNALYDVGMRLRAAELHDEGHGRAAIAALLGMPEETVREWLCTYRSAGIEVLAMMGKKHTPIRSRRSWPPSGRSSTRA